MNLRGNTILITGGGTGIGFSFAEKFVNLGNTVIICGRREDKLRVANELIPQLNTIKCDISKKEDLAKLGSYIKQNFPELNILINNAGIQRTIDLRNGVEGLMGYDDEILTNFSSQVYITEVLLPILLKQKNGAIVNVTSGLGFIPMARFPIYSATKAAMHSFTLSLRHQLRETQINVFEVIPPTVHDTELKGKPIERSDYSISSMEMAEAFISGFERDDLEISAGGSKRWINASKEEREEVFKNINR